MVFNSIDYAFFLPVALGLYWLIRRHREQNILLLIASYAFYGAWDYRFLGLMLVSTITDFTVGRMLARTDDERRRKRIFVVSLLVNLGILGFFKYFNFFTDSAVALFERVGITLDAPTLEILLPIGISFDTFHGISYTFDVYRRQIAPTENLINFALFVAYFPQLVAGPIGRAQVQLPQFENPRTPPAWDRVRGAVFLILLGLFKKVAIADALAPYVNSAFGDAGSAGAAQLLVGAYAFALQIYGDFSGYSDIARGSSRLFGIELLRNFDQPYLSRNITMFWRTWHISLSTWLRDYLYVPLGGNRRSKIATYRNLLLTMLLGGLWHGASWTFVIWGGLHGLFLAVHRAFSARARAAAPVGGPTGAVPLGSEAGGAVRASGEPDEAPPDTPAEPASAIDRWTPPRFSPRDILPALGTFHLVCFAWVFFRADGFNQAFDYLAGIFTLRGGALSKDAIATLLFAAIAVAVIDVVQRNGRSEIAMLRWRPIARGVVFAAFVVPIIVFSGGTPVPFIYFQF